MWNYEKMLHSGEDKNPNPVIKIMIHVRWSDGELSAANRYRCKDMLCLATKLRLY